MAFFYMDTDGGSDASDGTTWANAKLTLEGLLAVMSAGDTGYIQGAATDTAANNRTFTSPGTVSNPCKVIGVKDGTTNTGTSVVTSDLLTRGTDTLVGVLCTSSGTITMAGFCSYKGIHLTDTVGSGRFRPAANSLTELIGCELTVAGDIQDAGENGSLRMINSSYEVTDTSALIEFNSEGAFFEWYGGELVATAAINFLLATTTANAKFVAVDLSAFGNKTLQNMGGISGGINTFKNCKMPATYTVSGTSPSTPLSGIELIGCSDASSVAATDSIQDYQYEDVFGTIDLEVAAVRTGGADDDATGAFSYAMTPAASATLESSGATLKSPWMSVWVDGGSNTLTVYIANDSASTDYNLDEAWVEFYTPDAGDTAQYDQTFDAGDARLLDSTTAITDDTGSTWGGSAANHQKFSATVTTGYTGEVRARLHLAKRSATPDTLFLDPRIEIS